MRGKKNPNMVPFPWSPKCFIHKSSLSLSPLIHSYLPLPTELSGKSKQEICIGQVNCITVFTTPRTLQSMEFSRLEYWSGYPFLSPGDLPNPWIELWSPTLRVDSLPAEPPGKPKNTWVGSLSLLQGIFLTQQLNQGFLHCRQILCQVSYQGSPEIK